jgi:hypothetical protein
MDRIASFTGKYSFSVFLANENPEILTPKRLSRQKKRVPVKMIVPIRKGRTRTTLEEIHSRKTNQEGIMSLNVYTASTCCDRKQV